VRAPAATRQGYASPILFPVQWLKAIFHINTRVDDAQTGYRLGGVPEATRKRWFPKGVLAKNR